MPGLRLMGRWQLVQAMLLFSGGPLYTVMLTLAAIHVALGGGADVPRSAVLHLALAWPALIYAPKWLGYGELLVSRAKRARYGGAARLLAGIVAETVFTLLLDAVQMPHKALALARHALGARASWRPQNRRARGVTWAEAAGQFWPHTLYGLLVFALLARGSWGAVFWALPFAGGLPLAIPFCVLTSAPAVSDWLRRHRIAAIPEELPQAGASNRSMNHDSGSRDAASYHSATSGCARTAAEYEAASGASDGA
jgi:membrane glycosyltransferase